MNERTREALRFVFERQSVSSLVAPAPNAEQLDTILRAATTVPDHGELHPYRFVVVTGDGRERLGNALAAAAREQRPDLPPAGFEKVRKKAFAAPMLVVIIASPQHDMKIPEWEQVVAASCTGYAMVLAAHVLGVGAIWKTSPFLEGRELREVLGMNEHDRILGWINLGAAEKDPKAQRNPVALAPFVKVLADANLRDYEPGR